MFFYSLTLLFPFFKPKIKLLPVLFTQLLFFKEHWECITLVALYKRVTMRESLLSLFTVSNLLPSLFTR